MLVSVVVPAYDAEQTLPATLDSLQVQTHRDWEAIVVDDGSADATAALVEERMRSEPRLRLVRQPNAGVSSARNAGIAEARGAWLSFLDADDWLAPEALATLVRALADRPRLDAVHCGWTRIAPDGREIDEICPRTEEDMFSWHAHNCAFAIHALLVRRELVERAGGFDPSLATCEDWDLWMRLSRLGARWGRVDDHLAFYRMRRASASMAARRLLLDGLTVVDRAHGPDPRLAGESLARSAGEDASQRARARLGHAVYSAALAIGQGDDAVPLLEEVAGDRCEELGADQVAYALFEGVPLGAARVPSDWPSLSNDMLGQVAALLEELERISGAPELALRTKRMLERLVAETGGAGGLFEKIETVEVDLERPLVDVAVHRHTERLVVRPAYGGLALAPVELPACDGLVPADLIADAVADEHAWAILGEFFERTVYIDLSAEVVDDRLAIERAGRRVVDVALPPSEPRERLVHDYAGWEVLLQELCGDAATPNAAFYDESYDAELEPAAEVALVEGWAALELTAPLPELVGSGPGMVAASVGGATLGAVEVEPVAGRVSAGAVRRAICTQGGFELCRLAVREGLVGRPLGDGTPLRARLLEAAGARERAPSARAAAPAGVSLAPGWERRAARGLNGSEAAFVIARRRGSATGLSGSRAAVLPRSAAAAAVAAARSVGDPVIAVGAPGPGAPARYAPEIVWHDDSPAGAGEAPADAPESGIPPGPGRVFFETLFASGADPWRYTSEYEQGKYEQTLSLLTGPRPRRALELGCAEGHFTRQLAPRVERLLACDVSEIALQRARRRCADLANVEFSFQDLFSDPIEGSYDLIVCSELLYYAGDRARLDQATRAIAGALDPEDGRLLAAHANLVVDDPGRPGFDWDVPFGARVIAEAFAAAGLELVEELANPIYRIQAYRRPRGKARLRVRPARPARRAAPLPARLPREVEQRFLWDGGEVRSDGAGGQVTWELPILMYHRVAPEGSERMHEWRVTPDQFEQQLHYLRTAGYTSAAFEEWREVAERHQPLPGRRVMLTFDDGYEDFAEHAYPLLRQYELESTVFVVTDHVGLTNDWDRGYGETLPLMDWDTIRSLDGRGVSIGAHSAGHPMLTGLGLDEVVQDASRCRAELVERLGHLVRTYAYPYGDTDAAVARTVGACGFEFAVTTAGFRASATVPMLSLPRLNVAGTDSFEAFVRLLTPAG